MDEERKKEIMKEYDGWMV